MAPPSSVRVVYWYSTASRDTGSISQEPAKNTNCVWRVLSELVAVVGWSENSSYIVGTSGEWSSGKPVVDGCCGQEMKVHRECCVDGGMAAYAPEYPGLSPLSSNET